MPYSIVAAEPREAEEAAAAGDGEETEGRDEKMKESKRENPAVSIEQVPLDRHQ